jgi:hypothetical protein
MASCGGEIVATILDGAWRRGPPLPDLTPEELSRIAPLLAASGAASLGWWRIQKAEDLRDTAPAADLLNAHRRLALEDVMNVAAIEHIAALLGGVGIEPLIFKGWAVARHYAATYLRPFGDLDMWVRPQCHRAAAEILRAHSLPGPLPEPDNFPVDCGLSGKVMTIDLHADLERHGVTQSAAIELYQRSQPVKLGRATVRVPAMEDHLRIVAIHFLAHGAWRPLWLCDVAAMVEDLPPDFDWDLCLGRDPRVARWGPPVVGGIREFRCRGAWGRGFAGVCGIRLSQLLGELHRSLGARRDHRKQHRHAPAVL